MVSKEEKTDPTNDPAAYRITTIAPLARQIALSGIFITKKWENL